MDVVKDIAELLRADPSITALIGSRVFPLIVPEDGSLPCIVLSRLALRSEYTLDGPAASGKLVMQVDCIAQEYAEAKQIEHAVRTKLDGFTGQGTTSYIMGIFIDDVQDEAYPETESFVVTVTVEIFFRSKE